MSNFCQGCHYRVEETLGERACPFNSLYWDFLLQQRALLQANPRLGAVYKTLDQRGPHWQAALQKQAQVLRARIARGEA
jgi:deoxyribodipyrimidine photolyase-related protein